MNRLRTSNRNKLRKGRRDAGSFQYFQKHCDRYGEPPRGYVWARKMHCLGVYWSKAKFPDLLDQPLEAVEVVKTRDKKVVSTSVHFIPGRTVRTVYDDGSVEYD